MQLRECIDNVSGLRYMLDNLEIQSGLGKRYLYALPWLRNREEVTAELFRAEAMRKLMMDPANRDRFGSIRVKLAQVRDIKGTVRRITDHCVLDDLELFELKNFILLADGIRELWGQSSVISIPEVEPVIEILDPDGTRIPHFYISDIFSTELAALRSEIKCGKQNGMGEIELEELYQLSLEEEDRIRFQLSGQIRKYQHEINEALEQVALLDVLMAKAGQALKMGLSCPEIRDDSAGQYVSYQGLFNPQLADILHRQGKCFQPVSIKVNAETVLITGANMAGKTVLLKTVALAQFLVQFGFFVPAEAAEVTLTDEVLVCIGDDQDELNGLSSFAAEMSRINEIVQKVKSGERVLVLIDELARTTNPDEGKAIVNGVVELLTEKKVAALLTTHYNGIRASCRKLRVKGFKEDKIQGNLTAENINEFIDYSLTEDDSDVIPQEALRIAAILGVDYELLEKAKKFLK